MSNKKPKSELKPWPINHAHFVLESERKYDYFIEEKFRGSNCGLCRRWKKDGSPSFTGRQFGICSIDKYGQPVADFWGCGEFDRDVSLN